MAKIEVISNVEIHELLEKLDQYYTNIDLRADVVAEATADRFEKWARIVRGLFNEPHGKG